MTICTGSISLNTVLVSVVGFIIKSPCPKGVSITLVSLPTPGTVGIKGLGDGSSITIGLRSDFSITLFLSIGIFMIDSSEMGNLLKSVGLTKLVSIGSVGNLKSLPNSLLLSVFSTVSIVSFDNAF